MLRRFGRGGSGVRGRATKAWQQTESRRAEQMDVAGGRASGDGHQDGWPRSFDPGPHRGVVLGRSRRQMGEFGQAAFERGGRGAA
ncbi:hypothetical protein ACLOJK_019049 [Asimina triloba]